MRCIPKRIMGISLALLMTAATVSGCTAPQEAQPTLTAPSVPQETVIPQDREKPMAGNTENVAQIRLHNARPGWSNEFKTDNGMFLVVDSVEGLLDGLSSRGVDTSRLDLSAFDAVFFEYNRLVLIPRSTSSGSIRFSARIDRTADGVKVTPVGTMPEIGTADMADWLVLVSLSKAEYPGTVTVENVRNMMSNTKRYAVYSY